MADPRARSGRSAAARPEAAAQRRDFERLGIVAAFAGLLAAALLVFLATAWLDGFGPGSWLDPAAWRARLDPEAVRGAVGNAAEVVAGVLAIAVTVVAIVVELAANRYTHRITSLFVREPVNVAVMGFFVLTTVECFWISAMLSREGEGFTLSRGFAVTLGLVSLSLLVLLPYFGFVFRFLSPMNVIQRLRKQALAPIARAARSGEVRGLRERTIDAVEELEDVARSAMRHHDRSISMEGVDALAELVGDYAALRDPLPASWYAVDGPLLRDPDFVSMAPGALAEMQQQRLWFETKILRQYLSLFDESLVDARELANLIALNTRRLAEGAVEGHRDLLHLAIRFFNSYLRAAINARDLRSAYYVLHQYRQLAEALIEQGLSDEPLEVMEHLRFYGQLGDATGQSFLLEAVAYDGALLVECALERAPALVDPLLGIVLELDERPRRATAEPSLPGVRRAQVQLATRFLVEGDEVRASRIQADMAGDPAGLLEDVRDALLAETRPQYWEFTDRGVNFSYLPPERRAQLGRFFSGFGDRLRPPRGAAGC